MPDPSGGAASESTEHKHGSVNVHHTGAVSVLFFEVEAPTGLEITVN